MAKKLGMIAFAVVFAVTMFAGLAFAEEKTVSPENEIVDISTGEELMAAAGTGGSVRLTGDILDLTESVTISRDLDIDLNGKEICGADGTAINGLFTVPEDVTMNLEDSSQEPKGMIRAISDGELSGGTEASPISALKIYGTVNIGKGVTIKTDPIGGNNRNFIYGIELRGEHADLEMEDDTIIIGHPSSTLDNQTNVGIYVASGLTNARVNLKDVTITAASLGYDVYGIFARSGLLEVNHCDISVSNEAGNSITSDLAVSGCTVNVTGGGKMYGYSQSGEIHNIVFTDNNAATVNVTGDTELKIEGGYSPSAGWTTYSSTVRNKSGSDHVVNITGDVTVTLENMVYSVSPFNLGAEQSNVAAQMNIKAGTYRGGTSLENLTISGGRFEMDPSAYLADGYAATKDDEGLYAVNPSASKPIENMSTETRYASVSDALSEANDGDTLKMLCNYTSAKQDLTIGSSIRLDLNGQTLQCNSLTIHADAVITDESAENRGESGSLQAAIDINSSEVEISKIRINRTLESTAAKTESKFITLTGTSESDSANLSLKGDYIVYMNKSDKVTSEIVKLNRYSHVIMENSGNFVSEVVAQAMPKDDNYKSCGKMILIKGTDATSTAEITNGTYYVNSNNQSAVFNSIEGFAPVIYDGKYEVIGTADYYEVPARARIAWAISDAGWFSPSIQTSPKSQVKVYGGTFGFYEGDVPEGESDNTISPNQAFTTSSAGDFAWDNVSTSNYSVNVLSKTDSLYSSGYRFKIKDISSEEHVLTRDMVSGVKDSYSYENGEEIKPEVTVKDGDTELVDNHEYNISYVDNKTPGTAKVVLVGKGTYSGIVVIPYTITKPDIGTCEDVVLDGVEDSYDYTGKAIVPDFTLKYKDKYIHGYSYKFENNTDVGRATLTITAAGNFQGTLVKTFEITKADLADATCTSMIKDYYFYTGEAIEPVLTLSRNGVMLTEGTDFTVSYENNTDPGEAKVLATGLGGYQGTFEKTFRIVDVSIDPIPDQAYTGSYVKPELNVTIDGQPATMGKEYTASYSSNKKVGTATVTVSGRGNYSGSRSATFHIVQDLSVDGLVTIDGLEDCLYDGAEKTFDLAVAYNNVALTEGRDYSVSYEDNRKVGTATVTITGMGDYCGSTKATFRIAGDLSDSAMTTVAGLQTQVYDGSQKTCEPGVSFLGKELTKNEDYTLTFEDNVNAGTAKVIITGKGLYQGETVAEFRIEPKDITGMEVTLSEREFTYNGKAQKPEVSVEGLSSGDYSVTWPENPVNAGVYEIQAAGTGNYTGTLGKASYEILRKSISDRTVRLSAKEFTYNGQVQKPEVTVEGLQAGDYRVEWSEDSISAGTYQIRVTGEGNYDGMLEASYKIDPQDISSMELKVSAAEFIYSGQEQKPTVSIIGLTDGDYSVTWPEESAEAGSYQVEAEGRGNYCGKTYADYTISPCSIADKVITLSASTFIYTGKAQMPVVTVEGLKDSDYRVNVPAERSKIGTYTVTVTGTGNYKGTTTGKSYKITPAKASFTQVAGSKKITVKIKGQSGAASYQIYYKRSGKSAKTITIRSSKITVTKVLTGLRKGKKYSVKVRAYGAGKYGVWSQTKTIKVK